MERLAYRIITVLFVVVLASVCLRAQGHDSLQVKKVWVGLEVPSVFGRPFLGGYSLQPMVLFNISKHAALWGGTGMVKASRDSLFNNLLDYESKGWYLKGGADINLNLKAHNATGFRLGGGVTYAQYREKGQLRMQYGPELFEGVQPGNIYAQAIAQETWAAAFEFRQGFFADLERFGLQLQTQLNYVLKKPNNPAHPTHYIPGMGIYKPQPFLGDSRPPRRIIPGIYFYLFYKLY